MIERAMVARAFRNHFNREPVFFAESPGRANLMGGHVDYSEGTVLPAAIDLGVCLAAAPYPRSVALVHAVDLQDTVAVPLDQLATRSGRPLPAWARYPAGVAWAFREAGFEPCGMQVAFSGDLPMGAGLGSSAAVELAFAVTWQAMGGWEIDRMALAQLCQRAENSYVGVACGLMDQFVIAHGLAGHVLYFDTRSLDWEQLPLPDGTAVIIADSGLRRMLSDSAYNDRRAECEQAVAILKGHLPQIGSLRDVSPAQLKALGRHLPDDLRRRAKYVIEEIDRVARAAAALRDGDARAVGRLMLEAHASVRTLYETSLPELDALVDQAAGLQGCLGARMTGAGWGGCTVNLVEKAHTRGFVLGLRRAYRKATGRTAEIYVCRASDGARVDRSPRSPV